MSRHEVAVALSTIRRSLAWLTSDQSRREVLTQIAIGATVIDDELKAEHDILRSAMGNEVDKWLSAKFIEALDPRNERRVT